MAISCGGAITHTLVPPTPGPLLVAATLGADVGMVMLVGMPVAAPSAMMQVDALPYHAVYLVTAIGGGSLIGSWMNDSGFWVYAKMGGLTEAASLKTWTPMLIVLGVAALGFSLLFSNILPFIYLL